MPRTPIAVVLAVLALAMLGADAAPVDDAMTRPRLEKMLADGDEAWVVQTFRRHPGQTLPFVDSYLEGGLAHIEKGGDLDEAQAMFRTGVRFGELAAEAFGDRTLATYAASFASWSPQEQTHFRAGQAAYKAGRKATDPNEARDHYAESFRLARPLGDGWGMAMAAGGLARASKMLGDDETAIHYARVGARLYKRLRLVDSELDLLLLGAEVEQRVAGADPTRLDRSLNTMRAAWGIVRDRNPRCSSGMRHSCAPRTAPTMPRRSSRRPA
jgi:hypothetical protein